MDADDEVAPEPDHDAEIADLIQRKEWQALLALYRSFRHTAQTLEARRKILQALGDAQPPPLAQELLLSAIEGEDLSEASEENRRQLERMERGELCSSDDVPCNQAMQLATQAAVSVAVKVWRFYPADALDHEAVRRARSQLLDAAPSVQMALMSALLMAKNRDPSLDLEDGFVRVYRSTDAHWLRVNLLANATRWASPDLVLDLVREEIVRAQAGAVRDRFTTAVRTAAEFATTSPLNKDAALELIRSIATRTDVDANSLRSCIEALQKLDSDPLARLRDALRSTDPAVLKVLDEQR